MASLCVNFYHRCHLSQGHCYVLGYSSTQILYSEYQETPAPWSDYCPPPVTEPISNALTFVHLALKQGPQTLMLREASHQNNGVCPTVSLFCSNSPVVPYLTQNKVSTVARAWNARAPCLFLYLFLPCIKHDFICHVLGLACLSLRWGLIPSCLSDLGSVSSNQRGFPSPSTLSAIPGTSPFSLSLHTSLLHVSQYLSPPEILSHLVIAWRSLWEYELQNMRNFAIVPLYLQSLQQCLACNGCLINTCWMNERMNEV